MEKPCWQHYGYSSFHTLDTHVAYIDSGSIYLSNYLSIYLSIYLLMYAHLYAYWRVYEHSPRARWRRHQSLQERCLLCASRHVGRQFPLPARCRAYQDAGMYVCMLCMVVWYNIISSSPSPFAPHTNTTTDCLARLC